MNDRNRNEWRAAVDDVLAQERRRLGTAPTRDEVAAYVRGELPEAEADRVRALLIAYPEAAAWLTQDVGIEDENIVTDAEMAEDWSAIRHRIAPPRRDLAPRFFAVAAALTIVTLGVLLFRAQTALREERSRPHVLSARHEIYPLSDRRGPATATSYPLPQSTEDQSIALLLYEDARGEYALEIVDENSPLKTIWRARVVPRDDRTVEFSMPAGFLRSGTTYRIVLRRDGDAAPAATYRVRVQ